MRLLTLLILGLGLITTTGFKPGSAVDINPDNIPGIRSPWETVYLCKSSTAYAFHASLDCRGLSKCTHDIIEVSRNKAVNEYGRKPCGYCYK